MKLELLVVGLCSVSAFSPSQFDRRGRISKVTSRTISRDHSQYPTSKPNNESVPSLLLAGKSGRLYGTHHRLSPRKSLLQNLRRSFSLFMATFAFLIGSATLKTPPASASSAPISSKQSFIERVLPSRSKDQIIDQYVKKHMFDDEVYDPIDSLYREAYDDATKGTYPRALKEVISSVYGSDGSIMKRDGPSGVGVGTLLTSSIGALQKRGLSEATAITVLAALFVVAGPSAFLLVGMVIGGISKRNMNNLMKSRYGDSYTVDATFKEPDDVEAPDDEDDDDEEDSDDDDDEDDD